MSARPSIDIFCQVVDNFGDIGVCWRLARQLVQHPDCGAVRLWVDDLRSFSKLAPAINPSRESQLLHEVEVLHWDTEATACRHGLQPADMVIEAFACSPPAYYLAKLSPQQVWINLEYLSAEEWVDSCHGLPSLQANGLRKFFFFPGFSPRTGGLLREPGLIATRDAWQADPAARQDLLERLGVPAVWLQRLREGASLVYVYCYPDSPLPTLQQSLVQKGGDTLILMAEGIWPEGLPERLEAGGHVAVHTHDFVDQDTFDRLLWSSDLNVVRGEDSLVRAIWAGRPLIWQPYVQDDEAHLDKLEAWLARTPYLADIRDAIQAWNRGDLPGLTLSMQGLLQPTCLSLWGRLTRQWCTELAAQPDLAQNLLAFYAKTRQTR